MTDNKRSVIANNLTDAFKINQAAEIVPARVNPNIQPVFEVWDNSPTIFRSGSAAGTIYTVPAEPKKFYLKNVHLSAGTETPGGNNATYVHITPKGYFTSQDIGLTTKSYYADALAADLAGTTAVVSDINFDGKGLLLEPGSVISLEFDDTTGFGAIAGYEVI